MASLPTIPELIGLFVGVAMALALCSYLLYARGMSSGLSPHRIRRSLIAVWAVVLGMLVFLFAVRALIGTPLIEGSPVAGGFSTAQMTPAKWVLLAVAIAVISAGGLWLRKTVGDFEPRPETIAELPPEVRATPDEKC